MSTKRLARLGMLLDATMEAIFTVGPSRLKRIVDRLALLANSSTSSSSAASCFIESPEKCRSVAHPVMEDWCTLQPMQAQEPVEAPLSLSNVNTQINTIIPFETLVERIPSPTVNGRKQRSLEHSVCEAKIAICGGKVGEKFTELFHVLTSEVKEHMKV